MDTLSCLSSFLYSYCFSTVFLVYFIKLPFLLTREKDIVNEYYGKKFSSSFLMDLVLIFIYLLVAYFVANLFKVTVFSNKLLIVAVTTMILTGSFMLYFTSREKTNKFWSRWFHLSKYKSVMYDVILVSFVYIVYQYLYDISQSNKIV